MRTRLLAAGLLLAVVSTGAAQQAPNVRPGSITSEDVPYLHPVSYLRLTLYQQDLRMAYMDVAPLGTPNGRTVVLLHGNNFAGFLCLGQGGHGPASRRRHATAAVSASGGTSVEV